MVTYHNQTKLLLGLTPPQSKVAELPYDPNFWKVLYYQLPHKTIQYRATEFDTIAFQCQTMNMNGIPVPIHQLPSRGVLTAQKFLTCKIYIPTEKSDLYIICHVDGQPPGVNHPCLRVLGAYVGDMPSTEGPC